MPYCSNSSPKGAHEAAGAELLRKHGLTKFTLPKRGKKLQKLTGFSQSGELRDYWEKDGDHSILPDDCFVPQPFSSQGTPDFLIKVDGELWFVEFKSSKEGFNPTWNGGLPRPDYIYVFCSKHKSARSQPTTIFLGQDIVDNDSRRIFHEGIAQLNKLVDKINLKLANNPNNDYGLDYYLRNMFTHAGGAGKANYFTHERRTECEQNVLEFVS